MEQKDKAEEVIRSLWMTFKGVGDKFLSGLVAIFGTLWGIFLPAMPEDAGLFWWWTNSPVWVNIFLILTVVLIVATAIVIFLLQRPSYATLYKEHQKANKSAKKKAQALENMVRSILRQLAIHCKANSNDHRVTIYFHHQRTFIAVARYSKHPEFNELVSGKNKHSTNLGILGLAWGASIAIVRDLPSDREKWEEKVTSTYGYSREQVKSFRMQSRSYAAARIDSINGSDGVILFESTLPRGISQETLDLSENSLIRTALAEIITAHAKLLPNFEILDSETPNESVDRDMLGKPWKKVRTSVDS